MKSKRGKNEWPFQAELPKVPVREPSTRSPNEQLLAGLLARFSGMRLPGRPVAKMHTTLLMKLTAAGTAPDLHRIPFSSQPPLGTNNWGRR